MSERVATAALALGALALFYLLFIGSPARLSEDQTPRPTTTELRGNGYAAAVAWLRRNGVRVVSWRERFDRLDQTNYSERGNLLIVTLPAVEPFRTEEMLPLDRWVRAGNTLLVLAALADTPDWAENTKDFAASDVALLSGLEFREPPREASASDTDDAAIRDAEREAAERDEGAPIDDTLRDLARAELQTLEIEPRGAHPLSAGVERLAAKSVAEPQRWQLQVPLDDFALTLARLATEDEGTLFVRSHGAGRIVVATTASLFANRTLSQADNARLLANIVAFAVSADGSVLFDDLRQGLAASYEPERFWRDARLHWTLAVLVGVWFAWVLGGTRLRATRGGDSGPDEVELVTATGGLLASTLRSHVGAQYLLERFLRDIGGATGTSETNEAVWERLAAEPRVRGVDVAQLQQWYAAARARRRVPLVELQRTLERVRRQWFYQGIVNVSQQT